MTTKLSQYAGGGNTKYVPGMMTFDGSTGYYNKTGISTFSGNLVTGVVKFNRDSFTGGSLEIPFRVDGSGGYTRMQIGAFPSDHANSDYHDKIVITTQNSAGTNLVRVISKTTLIDGNDHVLFYAFDGDTGAVTFYADGIDADDLTNGSRIAPTTGTLAAGATQVVGVGATSTGALPFGGKVGYCGYLDAYLTNPTDFYHPTNGLQELDETTWTEWGAQPAFWNQYGLMTDNKGSAGNLTENGTITPAFVNTITFPILGLNTIGDAVASDLLTDKVAWVDGERIVGTGSAGPTYNNAVVLWEIGAGASGAYTPVIGDLEYAKAGVSLNTVPTFNRDGNGWCQPTSGVRLLIDLPAKTTTRRKYIYQGRSVTGHTTNSRLHVFTNYTDTTHHWYHRLIWNPGWATRMYEYNGAETLMDTGAFTNSLDDVIYFTYVVEDWGDTIFFSIQSAEDVPGTTNDIAIAQCQYKTTNRYNKDVQTCGLHWIAYTGDFELSSIEIYDVPD